jgi:HK97 family phage portal protein
MKLRDRARAAVAAFRGKSTTDDGVLRVLDVLGVSHLPANVQSEATYFACKKVLSEAVAKLPIRIQQFMPGGGVRIAREHRYFRMLHDKPNRYMTSSVFWGLSENCRNEKGNGYALIDVSVTGEPQLWPMAPDSVEVYFDNARLLKDQPDVYYRYQTPQGVVVFPSEAVLHFKSHDTEDGLVGRSVRKTLAETIRGNVKAQEFINKTISSGMTAKSVLNYTGSMNDANVQTLVKEVSKYAKGEMKDQGIENIIPMPVGFSLTPLNLKLADSQFLELRQYTAMQIASAFGVKPYQIGDYTKSSYASAEAQQLSFLVDTLLYIVKQYEEELENKLLTDDEVANGYHIKFDTSVLLRTEFKTMVETLSNAVSNFLMTPNEARERLDLPAKEGGDKLLGNGASIPVEYTGAQYTTTAREEEKKWLKEALTEILKTSSLA